MATRGAAGRVAALPYESVLQYKRATLLTRSSAREWATHGDEYWRVDVSRRQHGRLLALQAAVGADAVVRYAAPRFWRHRDLWERQAMGDIVQGTLFVDPTALSYRHVRMTWSPAQGLVGHSVPEGLPAEEPDVLARTILTQTRVRAGAVRDLDTRQHLATLANAVVEFTPSPTRRDEAYEDLVARPTIRELVEDDAAIGPLADIAVVSEAAHATRTSWFVLAMTERA